MAGTKFDGRSTRCSFIHQGYGGVCGGNSGCEVRRYTLDRMLDDHGPPYTHTCTHIHTHSDKGHFKVINPPTKTKESRGFKHMNAMQTHDECLKLHTESKPSSGWNPGHKYHSIKYIVMLGILVKKKKSLVSWY